MKTGSFPTPPFFDFYFIGFHIVDFMIGVIDRDPDLPAVGQGMMRDPDLRRVVRTLDSRQFRDLLVDSIQFAFRSDRRRAQNREG